MVGCPANRLSHLPPYLFVEIDRKKQQARAAGRDVIDFGVGDPDRPTPSFIVERMAEAICEQDNHRYARGIGSDAFRGAAADYLKSRFGVSVDAQREVIALIGTKEGIGHLPTAVVNPGDVVLIPEPGYPVYAAGTVFAGGECHVMPLREKNGWLPLFEDIPRDVAARAKLMFLNYPNNPTGACASLAFFERAVAFAREHDILLAHDAAYCDLSFDDPPPSVLQVSGARDCCIEFHSLSKTFNMTGWRIAFVAGNADALAALAHVKANLDSGPFGAVQAAGVTALRGLRRPEVVEQLEVYRRRRDTLVDGLLSAGWEVLRPAATFYVWVRCPGGGDAMSVATRVLDEADVVLIPGTGFGPCGEGYVRFALTVEEDRTREAVERIAKIRW